MASRWPRRRVLRISEGADGFGAVGREQGIDGAEHAVQLVPRAAAQTLAACLDGVACPPVHGGQEQVVHLDDLVQQRLAGFNQVTRDQCITLWLGEAA
jgi:hypothetical protein